MVINEITSSELNEFPLKIIDISFTEMKNSCGNVLCI